MLQEEGDMNFDQNDATAVQYYDKAVEKYQLAIADAQEKWFQQLSTAEKMTTKAHSEAIRLDAEKHAKTLWQNADTARQRAADEQRSKDYVAAFKLLEQATQDFRNAATKSQAWLTMDREREALESGQGKLTKDDLAKYGAEPWTKASGEVNSALAADDYVAALQGYRVLKDLLPAVRQRKAEQEASSLFTKGDYAGYLDLMLPHRATASSAERDRIIAAARRAPAWLADEAQRQLAKENADPERETVAWILRAQAELSGSPTVRRESLMKAFGAAKRITAFRPPDHFPQAERLLMLCDIAHQSGERSLVEQFFKYADASVDGLRAIPPPNPRLTEMFDLEIRRFNAELAAREMTYGPDKNAGLRRLNAIVPPQGHHGIEPHKYHSMAHFLSATGRERELYDYLVGVSKTTPKTWPEGIVPHLTDDYARNMLQNSVEYPLILSRLLLGSAINKNEAAYDQLHNLAPQVVQNRAADRPIGRGRQVVARATRWICEAEAIHGDLDPADARLAAINDASEKQAAQVTLSRCLSQAGRFDEALKTARDADKDPIVLLAIFDLAAAQALKGDAGLSAAMEVVMSQPDGAARSAGFSGLKKALNR